MPLAFAFAVQSAPGKFSPRKVPTANRLFFPGVKVKRAKKSESAKMNQSNYIHIINFRAGLLLSSVLCVYRVILLPLTPESTKAFLSIVIC
jgi:hypothetical protein